MHGGGVHLMTLETLCIAIVGAAVGSIITYYLNEKSHHRAEINAIADELDAKVSVADDRVIVRIDDRDAERFRRVAGWCRRRRFNRALSAYRAEQKTEYDTLYGTAIEAGDPDKLRAAALRLKKTLSRK